MLKYKHNILLIVVFAIVLIIFTGRLLETDKGAHIDSQTECLNPDEIIRLTNEYRVLQGRNELEKDSVLCEVAEVRAKEIVDT